MDKTKISVITSCLNSGKYLKGTILSIINQSHSNYELIIIDAGSTDSTNSVIDEFKEETKIQFYIEKNIGFYDGLKLGVKKSSGEYIMFMPVSDSYCSMDWFSECSNILDNDNDVSLVHGIAINNDEKGGRYFGMGTRANCPSGKSFFPFWLASFFAFSEHSICIRKNVFLKCINKKVDQIDYFNEAIKNDIKTKKKLEFNNFLKLTFNFNKLGYLSKYVPKIAAEVKLHSNSFSIIEYENNGNISGLYTNMVKEYAKQIFTGKTIHNFKNSDGVIIDTLEGYELSKCVRETITFRMYEKKYFGARDNLSQLGSKFAFKAKYTFAFFIRITFHLYYKFFRLISK